MDNCLAKICLLNLLVGFQELETNILNVRVDSTLAIDQVQQ